MRTDFTIQEFEDMTLYGYYDGGEVQPDHVVILVHGMAETIRRYDHFIKYLASNKIVTFAYDQRGHGKTADRVDNLGLLDKDGWIKMREELKAVIQLAKKLYPDLSITLMGHSMGSFVVRDYIQTYPNTVEKVILSGTGYQPRPLVQAGIILSNIIIRLKSSSFRSYFLHKVTFGAYNKKFEGVETDFDWLTRDRASVRDFVEDPFCGAIHSVGFFNEMSNNLMRILYHPTPLQKVQNNPMFIYSGTMDPVGAYGVDVKKSADKYVDTGYNVRLKLYENGRHEMHNEINKSEVYEDILNFITETEYDL